jgi:hypothetical protein
MAALIVFVSIGASACTFYFSYESITAPVGTVGEIGIRVQKTHNNCTLSSMDDYLIDGKGVQILGETPWETVGSNLYEKWIQVSLAEVTDGFVRISKDCIKEGYEEKILPITPLAADGEDAVWSLAWSGTYPFEEPTNLESTLGEPNLDGTTLTVGSLTVQVPDVSVLPSELPASVRLFATQGNDAPMAALLVGDGLFVRFDHLL